MKKTILTIALLLPLAVMAQQKVLPDTTVTIQLTNNKVYQLNNWMTYALTKLQDSEISAKDLKEMSKQYQDLMTAIMEQNRKQVVKKEGKKP